MVAVVAQQQLESAAGADCQHVFHFYVETHRIGGIGLEGEGLEDPLELPVFSVQPGTASAGDEGAFVQNRAAGPRGTDGPCPPEGPGEIAVPDHVAVRHLCEDQSAVIFRLVEADAVGGPDVEAASGLLFFQGPVAAEVGPEFRRIEAGKSGFRHGDLDGEAVLQGFCGDLRI